MAVSMTKKYPQTVTVRRLSYFEVVPEMEINSPPYKIDQIIVNFEARERKPATFIEDERTRLLLYFLDNLM
jgi:hypothetical protein